MKVVSKVKNIIVNCIYKRRLCRYFCFDEKYILTKKKNYSNQFKTNQFKIMSTELIERDSSSSKVINGYDPVILRQIKTKLIEKYNVTLDETPIKSENDSKQYLTMKLSNGLTALLISDLENMIHPSYFKSNTEIQLEISECYVKETKDLDVKEKEKLAACSMTVGVGTFDDPEDIPGLAHLLEHMLFMGSEKFPTENDFNSFVTSVGGSNNAVTDTEYTTYFFDCPEMFLEETMDRFANFFLSPLMKREAIVRERLAVESEFQMHSKNDALRIQQIISNTASKRNPMRKFMWGNLKTLKDNISDEELYVSLNKFWVENYSADRMTLVVQARLPLSTLGRWVAEYFDKIRCNKKPKDDFTYVDPPFQPGLFNQLYTVLPVTDVNLLRLTWALPPVKHLYKSKPTLYPSFMLSYEGQGSLMAYLKKQLWALSVIAGNGSDGTEHNSSFSLFTIGVLLTESGMENLDMVVQYVFAYIKMLRMEKPSETLFSEIQFLADTNFRFTPEILSSDYVQYLSHCMQLYPPVDYVTGSVLLFEFKPDQITSFLHMLTPDKVNVMLLSKTAADGVTLDRTEKWFETSYNMTNIPNEWLANWKHCKLNTNFFLPPPNPFIPTDFSMLPSEGHQPLYPEKLVSDVHMELWYKQDKKFRLPFGYINVYLISPYSILLPQNFVMCELFVSLFSAIYDEELYQASVAGLVYALSTSDCGLLLGISGYNEKLQQFLETIINMMGSFRENVTPGLFEVVKEAQRKFYYNDLLSPTTLAKELRMSVLCEPYCTSLKKLEVISSIDLKKLLEFFDSYFEKLYVKCLIQGNLSEAQAVNISQQIKTKLAYKPLKEGGCPKIRVRQIPKGENVLRVKALNREDRNCHITNYYQCGPCDDVKETCLVELLMMILAEPFFDMIRTKEQLGYFVSNDMRYTYGIIGFTLAVKFQSDKFTTDHVEKRMAQFLEKMKTDINDISAENFNRIKTSLMVLKLQADTQLADEVDRHWSEIETDEYVFDRLKRELNYLETLNKKDLIDYFLNVMDTNSKDSDISSGDRCLRKLSIQVDAADSGKTVNENAYTCDCPQTLSTLSHVIELIVPEEPQAKFIDDVDEFQKSLFIYPVVKFKL